MQRIVVETANGPAFVRSGKVARTRDNEILGFQGLKLTTSKRWAAKFTDRDEAISAIHQSVATGFYHHLHIQYAR